MYLWNLQFIYEWAQSLDVCWGATNYHGNETTHGPTPALLHFHNQPTREEFHFTFFMFRISRYFLSFLLTDCTGQILPCFFFIFLIYFAHIFLIFSHIDLVIFWLVLVWIYCGVFATIEGSIAPHLSPLVPQSGTRAQIWQIGRKITKEVGLVGKKLNHFLKKNS